MGYSNARDMYLQAGLDVALEWHLSANCWPPFPAKWVPVAKRAILKAQKGQWDAKCRLPQGVHTRQTNSSLETVRHIVKALYLYAFVDPVGADNGDDQDGQDGQDVPSIEQLMQWESEGGCETPCGCWVEPDGTCEHGNPSWLIVMGLV